MPEEKVQIKSKFNPTGTRPIFSWESPEFIKYKKSSKWYLYLIAGALILAAVFIWQKQWSGSALVIVAALVLAISSESKPENVKCAVYNEGVVANGKVYSFNEFKNFWMAGKDFPKIYFQPIGKFSVAVSLPLKDQDSEQLRLFVSKHLPEVQGGSDVIDSINSIFKI